MSTATSVRTVSVDDNVDMTDCPVCRKTLDKPTSLPCFHSVCADCLQQILVSGSEAGQMPLTLTVGQCPTCRSSFDASSLNLVKRNSTFVERLVADKNLMCLKPGQTACDACSSDDIDEELRASTKSMASKVCVDCRQVLCDRCSRPHMQMKDGAVHRVVGLDTDEMVSALAACANAAWCDQHGGRELELRCVECRENICFECLAEHHQQHECQQLRELSDELTSNFDFVWRPRISSSIVQLGVESTRLQEEKEKFLESVESAERACLERGEEMKRLIDEQVERNLTEVERNKGEMCKEIDIRMQEVKSQLVALEGINRYVSELITKGTCSEIANEMDELHVDELLKRTNSSLESVQSILVGRLAFIPTNIEDQNLIGCVQKLAAEATASSDMRLETRREHELEEQLAASKHRQLQLENDEQALRFQLEKERELRSQCEDQLKEAKSNERRIKSTVERNNLNSLLEELEKKMSVKPHQMNWSEINGIISSLEFEVKHVRNSVTNPLQNSRFCMRSGSFRKPSNQPRIDLHKYVQLVQRLSPSA